MKKIVYVVCLMLLVVGGISGCQTKPDEVRLSDVQAPEQLPLVTIKIKDYGTMEAELYPHIAPNTVNNFISLINQGFYNGLTIHRIEKGFVLQGGDPTGTGSGGPGYSIEGEFTTNGFLNELKHTEGVLSMARTNQPNSAGSQFFIMLDDAPHLDGNYAAFGKVISGMDIAHQIEEAGLNHGSITIEEMSVETYGVDYQEPEIMN
nr:peptidylprolyl isomerase [Turicibacter sp. TJ11]